MHEQAAGYQDRQHLFRLLSEQMKQPFLQIRNLAEIAQLDNQFIPAEDIQSIAGASLRLVDAYLLAAQQEYGQMSLALEPVSPSATLANVAYMIEPYARAHGLDVRVSIRGRYEPVMADKQVLEHAIFCLAHTLIETVSSSAGEHMAPLHLVLGTHRSKKGIALGVYIPDMQQIFSLTKARKLMVRARQPIKDMAATSASGLFIADSLVSTIGSSAKMSKHCGDRGISILLQPSRQLSML